MLLTLESWSLSDLPQGLAERGCIRSAKAHKLARAMQLDVVNDIGAGKDRAGPPASCMGVRELTLVRWGQPLFCANATQRPRIITMASGGGTACAGRMPRLLSTPDVRVLLACLLACVPACLLPYLLGLRVVGIRSSYVMCVCARATLLMYACIYLFRGFCVALHPSILVYVLVSEFMYVFISFCRSVLIELFCLSVCLFVCLHP